MTVTRDSGKDKLVVLKLNEFFSNGVLTLSYPLGGIVNSVFRGCFDLNKEFQSSKRYLTCKEEDFYIENLSKVLKLKEDTRHERVNTQM